MPISPDLLPAGRRAGYLAERRLGAYGFFEWYERADLDGPEGPASPLDAPQRRVTIVLLAGFLLLAAPPLTANLALRVGKRRQGFPVALLNNLANCIRVPQVRDLKHHLPRFDART